MRVNPRPALCLPPTAPSTAADIGAVRAGPPEIARTLSPELQALIGYTMPGTSFGYFAEYQHPAEALEEGAQPIDWASARPRI